MKLFKNWKNFQETRAIFFGKNRKNLVQFILVTIPNTAAALLEGLSFAFILLSLKGLDSGSTLDLHSYPLLSLPKVSQWLHTLNSHQLFTLFISTAIVMQILRSLLTYVGQVLNLSLATNIQIEAQQKVYEQIFQFSFPFVSRYKVGDLLEYTKIPATLTNTIMDHTNKAIVSGLAILASFGIMLMISVPLTLLVVVVFGLFGFSQKFIIRKISRISQFLSDHMVDFSKSTVQSLHGLRPIHIFDCRKRVIEGIHSTLQKIAEATKKLHRWGQAITPVTEVMGIFLVGMFLVLGEIFFIEQEASLLPKLLTFIIIVYRLNTRFQSLIGSVGTIAFHWGQVLRLEEILRKEDKIFDPTGFPTNVQFSHQISFHEVGLKYPGTEAPALEQLSMHFPKGAFTAIVGSSGAGKSSIMDLLLRLYDPSHGDIRVDQKNLKEIDLSSWRKIIGVVSQDTFIFNESVEENIRFGLPEASFEQIVHAAQMAGAHAFIDRLPEGYQTVLGERGHRLSGGERQKIALARALVRDPEILVLDEATSSLDSASERAILDMLEKLKGKKTLIVVAHRLSTIFDANQIIVIEKGRVVEAGSHGELLARNGRYAFFWNLQSKKDPLLV